MSKVALEEHFVTPDVIARVSGGLPDPAVWKETQHAIGYASAARLFGFADQSSNAMSRPPNASH
jgi:hypothetical protein